MQIVNYLCKVWLPDPLTLYCYYKKPVPYSYVTLLILLLDKFSFLRVNKETWVEIVLSRVEALSWFVRVDNFSLDKCICKKDLELSSDWKNVRTQYKSVQNICIVDSSLLSSIDHMRLPVLPKQYLTLFSITCFRTGYSSLPADLNGAIVGCPHK